MKRSRNNAPLARNTRMLAVMKAIGGIAVDITVGAEAFLAAGYGASLGRIDHEERVIQRRNAEIVRQRMMEVESLSRYYNLLYRLRKDGLLEQKRTSGSLMLSLTNRGKDKLAVLMSSSHDRLPIPAYRPSHSTTFTIITFDIPERERPKRRWLRTALRQLQFRQVQKSVYIGRTKIPRSFLDDLHALRLPRYVEIFEVSKGGSLRHLA